MCSPAKWDINDLLASQALAALDGPYVPWTAWAMRPAAIATVVNAILLDGLTRVVELGAGTSTIYAGRALKETDGELVSIEQDARWAAAVRALVVREGLDEVVRVVHAPIGRCPALGHPDWPIDAPDSWYDRGLVAGAVPSEIELLVVDGPIAGATPSRLVRLPAVPALEHQLVPPFTIVLDDADRPAEAEVARLWADWLELEAVINERTSTAVLRTDDAIFPSL
jgi:hypothetical protein